MKEIAVLGSDMPWKFQLDQIQNFRYVAIIDFNNRNIWWYV